MTLARLAGTALKTLVESRLTYSPVSGLFRWANGPRKGQLAGSLTDQGYRVISISGKNYKAHRLAWLMCWGKEPKIIDHVNRDRLDNRIQNLREVTILESQLNRSWGKRTLPRGVMKCGKKYKAQITIDGKCIYLGRFISADAAGEAYRAAKMEWRSQ